jgi:N-acetylglucosaminyl-diphospho-decaprenol L-rhamnosyltransferase
MPERENALHTRHTSPAGPEALDQGPLSVSVVVVSYDSKSLLDAIKSIAHWAEAIVVEQHPRSTVSTDVSGVRRDARVIRAGCNRGFGAGCNLGAANASGDVLVFLNPDAAIDEESLLILARAAVESGVGLAGPRIVDASHREDTRARNWSTPTVDVLHLLLPRRWIPNRFLRDLPRSDLRYVRGGDVPYIQGSCMAISRSVFFSAGAFDEHFFLYGEEEDLARRLASHNRTSKLVPDATATHIGGTSTAQVDNFATRQLFRSTILIYRKHSSTAAAAGGALVLCLALTLLLVTSPFRAVTPWRKRETPEWCRNAICGVLDGLLERPAFPPQVVAGPEDPLWQPPT